MRGQKNEKFVVLSLVSVLLLTGYSNQRCIVSEAAVRGRSPPPITDEEESPTQEDAPPQMPPEPYDPPPEAESIVPQIVPSEVPNEPEIQEPTESVNDCVAYGKESIKVRRDKTFLLISLNNPFVLCSILRITTYSINSDFLP